MELFLIIVCSVSAVLALLIKHGRKVFPKKLSETELSILAYDNFGHNFDIESLVNKVLSKQNKPHGTIFEWETIEEGKESFIKIYLKDYNDNNLSTSISLDSYKENGVYRSRKPWDEFYAEGSKRVYVGYDEWRTPLRYYEDLIDNESADLIKNFKVQFPNKPSKEKKFGTVA